MMLQDLINQAKDAGLDPATCEVMIGNGSGYVSRLEDHNVTIEEHKTNGKFLLLDDSGTDAPYEMGKDGIYDNAY